MMFKLRKSLVDVISYTGQTTALYDGNLYLVTTLWLWLLRYHISAGWCTSHMNVLFKCRSCRVYQTNLGRRVRHHEDSSAKCRVIWSVVPYKYLAVYWCPQTRRHKRCVLLFCSKWLLLFIPVSKHFFILQIKTF